MAQNSLQVSGLPGYQQARVSRVRVSRQWLAAAVSAFMLRACARPLPLPPLRPTCARPRPWISRGAMAMSGYATAKAPGTGPGSGRGLAPGSNGKFKVGLCQ